MWGGEGTMILQAHHAVPYNSSLPQQDWTSHILRGCHWIQAYREIHWNSVTIGVCRLQGNTWRTPIKLVIAGGATHQGPLDSKGTSETLKWAWGWVILSTILINPMTRNNERLGPSGCTVHQTAISFSVRFARPFYCCWHFSISSLLVGDSADESEVLGFNPQTVARLNPVWSKHSQDYSAKPTVLFSISSVHFFFFLSVPCSRPHVPCILRERIRWLVGDDRRPLSQMCGLP